MRQVRSPRPMAVISRFLVDSSPPGMRTLGFRVKLVIMAGRMLMMCGFNARGYACLRFTLNDSSRSSSKAFFTSVLVSEGLHGYYLKLNELLFRELTWDKTFTQCFVCLAQVENWQVLCGRFSGGSRHLIVYTLTSKYN